ncbi:MAG: hypothetical protein FWD68_17410 [Alphaproteobacteria bacterium]|nr:hypothetical protein [Alphaproteobacteria bacterium]
MTAPNQGLAGPARDPRSPFCEILAALSDPEPMRKDTVTAALAAYDAIAPQLRAIVTTAASGDPVSDSDTNAFHRALIFLAGKGEVAACPPLLRVLRRPEPTELIPGEFFPFPARHHRQCFRW